MSNIPWWGYVVGAGLAWGTYVPLVFYGGTELTTRPGTIGGRLASILCVGGAYFVLAGGGPGVLVAVRGDAQPRGEKTRLGVRGLCRVARAVRGNCVIFGRQAAG